MARAFVGLGANLGDPAEQIARAIEAVGGLPRSRVVSASSLYRTAPIGYAAQPDFVNAVVEIETALEPVDLLRSLQDIESGSGRTRSFRNAPRTLDLDLLLYDDRTIDAPALQVPHPRMHERAFVLAPLVEIAPDIEIPGRGAASSLLARLTNQRIAKL
ncbi:MAG: 2-amino-4-hydroxy-6-hydroxymethyldihydropteridine diphosphokinase [Burkholderiales bacterium]|jgi:2-amino-4-hydroxy-6-hydroxymethyldihydropteridine diphosphokinase|nr:2-amino-4-hydroxy-6-hydroxymethyldihydropteridine diphosphokinase [Burkholderiales bacterium]